MCGLAGYAGVQDPDKRLMLVYALGLGIDNRGGDAAGYVTLGVGTGPRYARKCGEWGDARERFIRVAASGNITMMHARFATCGKKIVENAHPFAIKREVSGKKETVLWGAHNGVVQSWTSAKKHNRDIDVDSQELFELIADKDYEGLRDITGYGVCTWINRSQLNEPRVNLVKMSYNGDIEIWKVKEGGYVWASTESILKEACKVADLTCETIYKIDKSEDIGKVIEIYPDKVQYSGEEGVHLYRWTQKSSQWDSKSSHVGTHGWSAEKTEEEESLEMQQWEEYWKAQYGEDSDKKVCIITPGSTSDVVAVSNDGPKTKRTRIVAV